MKNRQQNRLYRGGTAANIKDCILLAGQEKTHVCGDMEAFTPLFFGKDKVSPSYGWPLEDNPMSPFSQILLLAVIIGFSFPPAVRSECNPIQLPSDDTASAVDGGGLCTGKALPGSCPVKCFRADPVCGVDGITYWCGCSEALCAGTRVASLGFCDVGDGGSGPVSGQALLLTSDLGLYDFYVLTEQRVNWDREEASDGPKFVVFGTESHGRPADYQSVKLTDLECNNGNGTVC
ncbi:hypothetical protein RJ639_001730 [Escallonia herrerae]|uniref:Kazal-like domain-containing protein n=1 Tax=Escallonia herrerae TaxID=1293975 RepID=A0AA89BI69_9ASTE|nr:hypothetical protein RJ639_001730 [Escallonia herrerae]